jgi:hypothetical protein
VASTAAPFIVTFTLSPDFHAVGAATEASGEGLGACVWALGLALGLVASGEVDSHAPSSNAKANTARIFVVIFVAPDSLRNYSAIPAMVL